MEKEVFNKLDLTKSSSIFHPKVLEIVQNIVYYYFKSFNLGPPYEYGDLLHDVLIHIHKCSYLQKYDKKRPFKPYISVFIYRFFCTKFNKQKANKVLRLNPSLSTKPFDFLESTSYDLSHDVEAIFKILETYKYSSFFIYDLHFNRVVYSGIDRDFMVSLKSSNLILVKRSLSLLFHLLLKGYKPIEIKKILWCSKSWVSIKMKFLKRLLKERGFYS